MTKLQISIWRKMQVDSEKSTNQFLTKEGKKSIKRITQIIIAAITGTFQSSYNKLLQINKDCNWIFPLPTQQLNPSICQLLLFFIGNKKGSSDRKWLETVEVSINISKNSILFIYFERDRAKNVSRFWLSVAKFENQVSWIFWILHTKIK